jgi:transposase
VDGCTDPERSKMAVAMIGQLYGIEREISGQSPKRKKRVRRSRATNVLRRLKKWLDREILKVPPQSPMAQAIQYVRGHWDGLLTYTKNGAVEIDTNRVERSFRGWKLGSKNWLFWARKTEGDGAPSFTR